MIRGTMAFAAASLSALAACSVPSTSAVVHVRDAASREPIHGAIVRITALDPRHPLKVSDMLKSSPPSVPEAATGPDGAAPVNVPEGYPLQVHVMVAPEPFESVYLDAWHGGATDWVGPPTEPPSWEVMIGPR